MIDIKMLTESAFETIRTNADEVAKMIENHPSDSSWLKGYLGFEPFEVKKYTIEDFVLTDDSSTKGQIDNAISLYESLHKLPRHILCDARFWGWVIFEKGYKLAQKIVKPTKETIKSRWFDKTARRSLMLNVLGRLYFKVDVSIGDGDDKYKLTKFIFEHHTIYKNFAYRNIAMLKPVTLAVLQILKESEQKYPEVALTDYIVSPVLNEASKIGSVQLIDSLSFEEVYTILKPKVEKIMVDSLTKESN